MSATPASQAASRPPASERKGFAGYSWDTLTWVAFGVAGVVFVAYTLYLTRNTSYYVDETNFFQSVSLHPRDLLTPVNGHLLLVPRLAYAISFDIFGAAYLPFRLMQAGAMLACSILFFVYGKRRVGNIALAPALILLFWGSSYEITLSPEGIPNIFAAAFGLGAFVALDANSRRGDLAACGLLVLALASYSVALAFTAAVAVSVLIGADRFKRLWIFVVPLVLYGIWFLFKTSLESPFSGFESSLDLGRITDAPSFIANSAAAVTSGIFGLNYDRTPDSFIPFNTDPIWGWIILGIGAAALAWRLKRGSIPRSMWMCMAFLVVLWLSFSLVTAIELARTPEQGRYLYPGAVAMLLVAVEAARDVKFSRPPLLAAIAVVTALSVAIGAAHYRQGSIWLRNYGDNAQAQFTSLQIARDTIDPDFVPSAGYSVFMGLRAEPFLDVVDRIGDPGYSIEQIEASSEATRASVDSTLIGALRIALDSESAPGCSSGEKVESGAVTEIGPPGVVLVASEPTSVAIQRFADNYPFPLGTLEKGKPTALTIPEDRADQPWQLIVTGAEGGATKVCPLDG